jgi:diguanylate cyclase (GGDEF)-like protein
MSMNMTRSLRKNMTLSVRIYLAATATIGAVLLYFFQTLYAQQQLSALMRAILDRRIVTMQSADRIKLTLSRDEMTFFHYIVTRNKDQLAKGQQLGQAAIDEINILRRLSPGSEIQTRLDTLEAEIPRYFSDAQSLVDYVQRHALPPDADLVQAAAWARHRPQARKELGRLSAESDIRLARINTLCDEIISINQKEISDARDQMARALARGRRDALLAGFLVCWVVLLLSVSHIRSLLYPLRALLGGVQRVEQGDLAFQIPLSSVGEVGQLTDAFNRMTRTVSEQRRLLMQENITDGLTGLYNQRYFRILLRQEMERAQRLNMEFSLLMIDIDHFKQYNDTLGHEIGNELLKIVSSTVGSSLREIDALARYGGDELSVILPGASAQVGRILAQRIEQAIAAQRLPVEGALPKERLTLSMGGATYPKDAATIDDLIRTADAALYEAKGAGRACIRWASSFITHVGHAF